MKTMRFGMSVAVGVVSAAMLLWGVGCEKSPTSISIDITPPSATMTYWPAATTFTASLSSAGTNGPRQLYYPLEWSMSDPGLGRFLETAGNTAIYEAIAGPGVNTITVHDQAGSEGTAAITQLVE